MPNSEKLKMPLNNQNQMITEKKYTINTRIENENYNL